MTEYKVRRLDGRYLMRDDYQRDVWVQDAESATNFPDLETAIQHSSGARVEEWVDGKRVS
jgi:hypothetical protein